MTHLHQLDGRAVRVTYVEESGTDHLYPELPGVRLASTTAGVLSLPASKRPPVCTRCGGGRIRGQADLARLAHRDGCPLAAHERAQLNIDTAKLRRLVAAGREPVLRRLVTDAEWEVLLDVFDQHPRSRHTTVRLVAGQPVRTWVGVALPAL